MELKLTSESTRHPHENNSNGGDDGASHNRELKRSAVKGVLHFASVFMNIERESG
jgi:hypothetical protein